MSRSWASDTRRLFVACDLPHEAAVAIDAWQQRELETRDELRVAASVHLTLCFLGDVPLERIADVEDALGAMRFSPLELDVAGPVFLPGRGPKRVVALELVDHGGALAALQADVAQTLAERRPTPVKRLGVPDQFGEVATEAYLFAKHGFGVEEIKAACRSGVRQCGL